MSHTRPEVQTVMRSLHAAAETRPAACQGVASHARCDEGGAARQAPRHTRLRGRCPPPLPRIRAGPPIDRSVAGCWWCPSPRRGVSEALARIGKLRSDAMEPLLAQQRAGCARRSAARPLSIGRSKWTHRPIQQRGPKGREAARRRCGRARWRSGRASAVMARSCRLAYEWSGSSSDDGGSPWPLGTPPRSPRAPPTALRS
eukprot:1218243-Prymnesium_polylepis.1